MKLRKGNAAFERAMDDVAEQGDPSLLKRDFPRLIQVELAHVHPRPDQPRRHFDAQALRELADSINRQGLLQPIIVRAKAGARGDYDLVAGERRWRAVQLLGWDRVNAIVSTGDAAEIALVENLQRVDLSPAEEARGLQALMDSHGYTQEAAAAAVGWSRTQVNRALKLLTLPDAVLEECATLHLSRNAMIELALAEDPAERAMLMELVRRGGSVKALREARQPKQARRPAETRDGDRVGKVFLDVVRVERSLTLLEDQAAPLTTIQRAQLDSLYRRLGALLARS
ncbi:ParB/RepB/Spo0J family partition protein [Oleisolibacter albus]|uniref:ParB/RepB/Spo0J family partition protein n=1 Tax=Oleisolibacter albus TaxID=2171757 RepID=UPI000DF17987|nr:ParB/RepB/Spo0J family partition protein [Oleisolibacter albus]